MNCKDCDGEDIKVGDVVLVEAKVLATSSDTGGYNLDLETVETLTEGGRPQRLNLSSRQVHKHPEKTTARPMANKSTVDQDHGRDRDLVPPKANNLGEVITTEEQQRLEAERLQQKEEERTKAEEAQRVKEEEAEKARQEAQAAAPRLVEESPARRPAKK